MSDVMSVQQKEGKLREKPSFLGKISKKLPYGTKVTVAKEQGDWYNIKVENLTGWLHKSSLTEKEIVLKAGAENVKAGVDNDELVLAGKGFNSQVEKSYSQSNPELNYGLVDRMEKLEVNPVALESFVKDGGLTHV